VAVIVKGDPLSGAMLHISKSPTDTRNLTAVA
jgi:hypothetical protein